MPAHAAVLTGDLVDSTKAGPAAVERAMTAIAAAAGGQAAATGTEIRFDRFRGDGWQIHCAAAGLAFRVATAVLAHLGREAGCPATRIAIATGGVTLLPASGLAGATGPAFLASGRTLDRLGRRDRLRFAESAPGDAFAAALFAYLDWQAGRWTPEQAEAVAIALERDPPLAAGAVAARLGISRQAADTRLRGAGFAPIREAFRAFARAAPGQPHA